MSGTRWSKTGDWVSVRVEDGGRHPERMNGAWLVPPAGWKNFFQHVKRLEGLIVGGCLLAELILGMESPVVSL